MPTRCRHPAARSLCPLWSLPVPNAVWVLWSSEPLCVWFREFRRAGDVGAIDGFGLWTESHRHRQSLESAIREGSRPGVQRNKRELGWAYNRERGGLWPGLSAQSCQDPEISTSISNLLGFKTKHKGH